jgi:hypothetical protein
MAHKRKMIYLACPLTVRKHQTLDYDNPYWFGDEMSRINFASQVADSAMAQGFNVFSPLTYQFGLKMFCPAFRKYGWTFWQRLYWPFIEACDELWIVKIEGHQINDSHVWDESQYASSLGKTVRDIPPHEFDSMIMAIARGVA